MADNFCPLYVGQGNLFERIGSHIHSYVSGSKEIFDLPDTNSISDWKALYAGVYYWEHNWNRRSPKHPHAANLARNCPKLLWMNCAAFLSPRMASINKNPTYLSNYIDDWHWVRGWQGLDTCSSTCTCGCIQYEQRVISAFKLILDNFYFIYWHDTAGVTTDQQRRDMEAEVKADLSARGMHTYGKANNAKGGSKTQFVYPLPLIL